MNTSVASNSSVIDVSEDTNAIKNVNETISLNVTVKQLKVPVPIDEKLPLVTGTSSTESKPSFTATSAVLLTTEPLPSIETQSTTIPSSPAASNDQIPIPLKPAQLIQDMDTRLPVAAVLPQAKLDGAPPFFTTTSSTITTSPNFIDINIGTYTSNRVGEENGASSTNIGIIIGIIAGLIGCLAIALLAIKIRRTRKRRNEEILLSFHPDTSTKRPMSMIKDPVMPLHKASSPYSIGDTREMHSSEYPYENQVASVSPIYDQEHAIRPLSKFPPFYKEKSMYNSRQSVLTTYTTAFSEYGDIND